jgi:5-methylthioadenosine/S-adenosylhomocysteine deaminase
VVPVEPPGAVLPDHAVALRDGLVEAVLPRAEAESSRFAGYAHHALDEHVLIPGLINACAGAAPSAWCTMLRGGSTCVADVFTEPGLEAVLAGGMRVAASLKVGEADPDGDLARGLALRDRWREHPRVSFFLSADAALPEATLRKLSTMAAEVQLPVHLHGRAPYRGLPGPELVLVNPAHEGLDLEMLAKHGVSLVHVPAALSRMPVARMVARGINVALGSARDLLQDLRIAALPAAAALHAATLGGARALGLEDRIGSIVPGKVADLVAARLDVGISQDPVSAFVYLGGEHQVEEAWIAGKPLLREGNSE